MENDPLLTPFPPKIWNFPYVSSLFLLKASLRLTIKLKGVFQPTLTTGSPKIKLDSEKHHEIAIHGSKMCILHVKRDKLGPNHSKLCWVTPECIKSV